MKICVTIVNNQRLFINRQSFIKISDLVQNRSAVVELLPLLKCLFTQTFFVFTFERGHILKIYRGFYKYYLRTHLMGDIYHKLQIKTVMGDDLTFELFISVISCRTSRMSKYLIHLSRKLITFTCFFRRIRSQNIDPFFYSGIGSCTAKQRI